MIAIVCLDDKNGMSFNHRRQSRDVCLRTWMMEMTRGSRLWMSDYSAGQFSEKEREGIWVSNSFLEKAGEGDYVFVEDDALAPYERKVEKLVVFRWNRVYPGDRYFDLDLTGGTKQKRGIFPGNPTRGSQWRYTHGEEKDDFWDVASGAPVDAGGWLRC